MRNVLLVLLCVVSVSAQVIGDYPYFLLNGDFNGYIIKGDERSSLENAAVNVVVNQLPSEFNPVLRVFGSNEQFRWRASALAVSKSVRKASEVDVLDKPAIIVGTPCSNEWVQIALPSVSCGNIPPDEALIIIRTIRGNPVIVVTGGSPRAVLQAAEWLHSDDHYRYQGAYAIMRSANTVTIGDSKNVLGIGQPIGQLTPVVSVGSYQTKKSTANSYLKFPNGKVVFGKTH